MLRPFLLLVLLSVTDAWCTVAEAGHFNVPITELESNPYMRLILAAGGPLAMVAAKLLPLAILGAILIYRPMPRAVRALITVFSVLMVYHLALWL